MGKLRKCPVCGKTILGRNSCRVAPDGGSGHCKRTGKRWKKGPLGEGANRLAVVHGLDVGLADADLIALMRDARDARAKGAPTVTCVFAGYDDDPREVKDIPEVRELCRRLVAVGYPSWLDVTTTMRKAPTFNGGLSLGAWEVWRLARGEYGVGAGSVSVEAFQEFIKKHLAYMNSVADDHLTAS